MSSSAHSSVVGIAIGMDSVGTLPKTSPPPSASSAAAASLHVTLDHPHSFAAFYHWLSARGHAHVLDFWLAIWAFRRAWAERDPRAQRIGIAFHRRFVSPRTGCCEFLPASLRAEHSERLQREPMREHFFDACAPHAWACLTHEHMQFTMTHTRGLEKQKGGDTVQHQRDQMAEKLQQRETAEDGECGKETECRAFALQLVHKLDALARAAEAAAASESGGEEAEDARGGTDARADAAVTPERMCAWMQFASAYGGFTALSSSSCYNADGISSSSSSIAGGYATFKPNIVQPVAQAVQQQHQQRHCDNVRTTTETPAAHCVYSSAMSSCCAAVAGGDNELTIPMMTMSTTSCSSSGNGTSPTCSMGTGGAAVMTITYREAGGVGPPFVVRVAPQALITFREFRHLFAIPARSNKRFLFKEHRIGEALDSAHFQWTAIYDDECPLPVFFGQIVAECRTLSESD